MKNPSLPGLDQELLELLAAYLDGSITDEQFDRFQSRLAHDSRARQIYFDFLQVHEDLSDWARQGGACHGTQSDWECLPHGSDLFPALEDATRQQQRLRGVRLWTSLASVVLVALTLVFFLVPRASRGLPVARLGTLDNCLWLDEKAGGVSGEEMFVGKRLELSSGQAELIFNCGAVVTLTGPSVFEIESAKGGYLLLGQAKTVADTPAAKGFTLRTRSTRIVDLGTEFITSASPNGQSRIDVTSGEVQVSLTGDRQVHRLKTGDALCVELGERQIVTRIESGDGTAAFRFPTIAPPSDKDYADASQGHAKISVAKGRLMATKIGRFGQSGPVTVLTDGRGQSHQDAPEESAFFENYETGCFLMDLGQSVSIQRINSYSWHQHVEREDWRDRAVQKFRLYGYAGNVAPPVGEDLVRLGWIPIAKVNSDHMFGVTNPLDRPAQQACSITSPKGSIGKYRFLLWCVEPTRHPYEEIYLGNNTFFGEIDVFVDTPP